MSVATEAEFSFGPEFQEAMLSLMLNDLTVAIKVAKYIPQERLYSEAHKYLYDQIKKKIETSGVVPSYVEIVDGLKTADRAKRKMLKTFCEKIYNAKPGDPDYIKEKLTDYAKRNTFIDIFQTAQTFYNAKEHDKAYTYTMEGINELYSVSLKDDVIIPIHKFEEVRQIHINKSILVPNRIPTNIDPLDKMLRGGLEKGELGILLAEPKKGKSIGLIHFGCAALMTRRGRVAHFVLEGTTEQTIMRYQSRLTGIPYRRLEMDDLTPEEQNLVSGIGKKYLNRLDLIPFNLHWDYTVLDLDNKIKELKRVGRAPDLIVVDYGDLLKHHDKGLEKRHEQAEVFRGLKKIAMIHSTALWTASQARRPNDEPDEIYLLRAKDISECYEKVRIGDLVVTLNQTPREKSLGILRVHVDIYRSSDGDFTIRQFCDFERMIFYSKRLGHSRGVDTPEWLEKKSKKRKK